MKNGVLIVGTIASLVMAMATPAILPNVVFAQADVRQEDRRADRGGRGRQICSHKRQEGLTTSVVSPS